MYIHQIDAFPISFRHPLEIAFAAWTATSRAFREKRQAARQARVVAALPPHLRQDVGELDCRPPQPAPLAERLKSHQQTLETMWLRQF